MFPQCKQNDAIESPPTHPPKIHEKWPAEDVPVFFVIVFEIWKLSIDKAHSKTLKHYILFTRVLEIISNGRNILQQLKDLTTGSISGGFHLKKMLLGFTFLD